MNAKYFQYAERFFKVLLSVLVLMPLAADGVEDRKRALSTAVAKGKWQCTFEQQFTCSLPIKEPAECAVSENKEDAASENKEDNVNKHTHWYELDFDTKPIKLYFCSKSGCATDMFGLNGELTFSIHGGTGGFEGVTRPRSYAAIFLVESLWLVFLDSDAYIFRLDYQGGDIDRSFSYPAALDVVKSREIKRHIGECEGIDDISKLGNPFDSYEE